MTLFPTHSSRVERWLGPEQTEFLASQGRGWYGPPIPIMGIPGNVYLRGGESGGDFVGRIDGGGFANLYDFTRQRFVAALRRWNRRQEHTANAGFASLGDLIAEATAGKKRVFQYQKVGVTGVVAATNTLWYEGAHPTAGSAGAAAPGGTAYTSASAGTWPFTDPTSGDTQHLTRWDSLCTQAGNTLLLYDRIFGVAKTMSSTANEAVTGVPTRYQSTTGGAADSAEGNFLVIETTSALGATAHNWDSCTYTDQSGNATITLPTVTGNASTIAKRLDQPTGTWFTPLAAGDTGIKALSQMHCSASVTGGINFAMGHFLALLAHPVANTMWPLDGVTGAFNLNRIFDGACLAFLEMTKPSTTAATYNGWFETVSG
jgi:hypothetical protein